MELQDFEAPWRETWIVPVADLQLGHEGADTASFSRFIAWAVAAEKRGIHVRFVGVGDYLDWVRPSMRQRLKATELDEQLREKFEQPMEESVEDFLKLVKHTKGMWLGLVRGHHLYEFGDRTNTDSRIAEALGCAYWGDSAIVTLHYKRTGAHTELPIDLFLAHGCGSSVAPYGPLLKLNRDVVPGFDCDIYIIGHYTKRPVVPIETLYKTRHHPPRLGVKLKWMIGAGGWLRGYKVGSTDGALPGGSYVERGLMRPVSIGGTYATVTPVRHSHTHIERLETWAGASRESVDTARPREDA